MPPIVAGFFGGGGSIGLKATVTAAGSFGEAASAIAAEGSVAIAGVSAGAIAVTVAGVGATGTILQFAGNERAEENRRKAEGDSETVPDLDKVDDSYLKKKGIDAHELKKDIYGKKAKLAEYDIYIDKKTGQLYTQRKPQYNKAGEPAIPTGEYIK